MGLQMPSIFVFFLATACLLCFSQDLLARETKSSTSLDVSTDWFDSLTRDKESEEESYGELVLKPRATKVPKTMLGVARDGRMSIGEINRALFITRYQLKQMANIKSAGVSRSYYRIRNALVDNYKSLLEMKKAHIAAQRKE